MPTVLIPASALDVTGYEAPKDLEENLALAGRLREVRLGAGKLMGLGDVENATVPKLTLLAPPRSGGAVSTRTFIPVRCHTSIGVLGAASVAAGLKVPGGVGEGIAEPPAHGDRLRLEHPTGFLDIDADLDTDIGRDPGTDTGPRVPRVRRTAVVRTARKIFDGTVFPRPPATTPAHPLGGTDDSAPR
jgi:4-oxalomesaconate tautomerase